MTDTLGSPSGTGVSSSASTALRHAYARPPTELTRFVGRVPQLEALRELALRERLVTLTGPGGIGKTRTALELAHVIERDRPVAWLELSGVSEPGLLTDAVARALGVSRDVRSIHELGEQISGDAPVLFLDGCEHLVDPCAELAEALLTAEESIHIIATSREALGVRGERAWLVPPLGLPATDATWQAQPSEAVQLFLDRARDVVPGFELTEEHTEAVAEICRRLDGIPLALELAAARVKVLSPHQILERLDDMFRLLAPSGRRGIARHRTLGAAMGWSYDLLPPALKASFRRLCVFRGGFDLDAAEAVMPDGAADAHQTLDHLALLVDRSLVGVRELDGVSRYHLLEPVRQYGERALTEAGEMDPTAERHARWYLSVVSEGGPKLLTPERNAWSSRLEAEFDNLRAALGWSRDADATLHVALAGAMWPLWLIRGSWTEARSWLAGALEVLEAIGPRASANDRATASGPAAADPARPEVDRARVDADRARLDADRARLLYAAGALDAIQARPAPARGRLEEAIAFADRLGDDRLGAYARNHLGLALAQEGRPECEAPLLAAREWFEANGDGYALRLTLIVLGNHYASVGALDRAKEAGEKAVELGRSFGQGRELATALESLAILHVRRGDLPAAEPLLVEALSILLSDWGAMFVARALQFLALVRWDRGDAGEAGRLFGAAERLREISGAAPFPIEATLIDERVRVLSSTGSAPAFEAGRAEGRRLDARALVAGVVGGSGERAASAAAAAPPAEVRFPLEAAPSMPDIDLPDADLPDADLRVLALGPLHIHLSGERLPEDAWPFAKPRELLLFLLLHPRGATRDEISRALWPDATAAQLKNSFHVALHHLRKALGDPGWVVIEEGCYRLSPQRSVYFDLDDFEARAGSMLQSVGGPGGPGARAQPGSGSEGDGSVELSLREALALVRGDFAQDQAPARWLDEPADRARALRARLGVCLGERLERAGRHSEAADVYRGLVLHDELHEELHRRFMLTLARSGHRAEALRHYERLRELLLRELEAEPEDETRLVWERIRTGVLEPELPRPTLA